MKIAMENAKDGKLIDHRSFVIDKGQRYLRDYVGMSWRETGMTFCKEI
jgi:hypothetical protein